MSRVLALLPLAYLGVGAGLSGVALTLYRFDETARGRLDEVADQAGVSVPRVLLAVVVLWPRGVPAGLRAARRSYREHRDPAARAMKGPSPER